MSRRHRNEFIDDEVGCSDDDDDDDDPMKPITHLIYLDANNLYGWAMSQMLPTHNFRWLTAEEITNLLITQLDVNSEDGYIFEVNCFPYTLHCTPFTHCFFD